MTPRLVPIAEADQRDLNVLAQREDGADIRTIARVTQLSPDLVETILACDTEEFPDEPLQRRSA